MRLSSVPISALGNFLCLYLNTVFIVSKIKIDFRLHPERNAYELRHGDEMRAQIAQNGKNNRKKNLFQE